MLRGVKVGSSRPASLLPYLRTMSVVGNEADGGYGGIAKRIPPLTGDKGGLRHRPCGLLKRLHPLICPTGNLSIRVSSPICKNILLRRRPKSNLYPSPSRPD